MNIEKITYSNVSSGYNCLDNVNKKQDNIDNLCIESIGRIQIR